ncbi:MAG: UDP-N-acetylmuramoyl-L-alanine--D-glutamate ligase [Methylotetracoccus sp.]
MDSRASLPGGNPLGLGRDARVLVVGLGKTGLSVARFLAANDIRFAVVDSRDSPPGLDAFAAQFTNAALFLGGFSQPAFDVATHLVVSPGVPLELEAVQRAQARGVPVFGDADLFACAATAPIVGITGSNGKSTVTTLLGEMALQDGRAARVGGNLGEPMLDLLDPRADVYVLELSSFQLERSALLKPDVATVLNVTPDHMDRYSDLEQYAASKARIFAGNGVMVLNRDDPAVRAMALPERRVLWFGLSDAPDVRCGVRSIDGQEWLAIGGEPLLRSSELRIRGRHNLSNALAAIALGDSLGLSHEAMVSVLRRFSGLDHRMQWVAEIDGVVYINDSKATNVGACIAALSGLDTNVVLIAGGDGKGADFSELAAIAAGKLRAAVLVGRDAPLLEAVLAPLVPVVRAGTMHEAVLAARRAASTGDTVLLAPACASLDQYRDYQERGRFFVEAVRSLTS